MKNTKFLTILILFLTIQVVYSQKVKIKKNTVFVNDKEYLTTSDRGMFKESVSLYSLNGSKEIVFILDVPPQTSGEIKYPYYHYLVKFIGTGKEIRFGDNRLKKLIKELYKSNVITDDGLNIEQVNTFVEKYK